MNNVNGTKLTVNSVIQNFNATAAIELRINWQAKTQHQQQPNIKYELEINNFGELKLEIW